MKTRIIQVGSGEQIVAAAKAGAEVLLEGGLVGFATETVYGIAAVAGNAKTMARLRQLKQRPENPFSVHLGRVSDVSRYVSKVPLAARLLISRIWPGPVTLLLPTGGRLADEDLQRRKLHDVLCSDDTIGLRCPDQPLAMAMLEAVSEPVVAPSANLAGRPSPRRPDEVLQDLDGKIDLLLDSGPTRYGKDSTIVEFSADGAWQIRRQGVYSERMIRRLTALSVLLVCTGNTCRSPMAAGIAEKLLADELGCEVGQLNKKGVTVASAGLFAPQGQVATPEAVEAASSMGADISRHRSQKLTSELIRRADVVFCMTSFHVEQVRRLAQDQAEKVRLLDSRDIPDPVGGGLEEYLAIAKRIRQALKTRLLKEMVP